MKTNILVATFLVAFVSLAHAEEKAPEKTVTTALESAVLSLLQKVQDAGDSLANGVSAAGDFAMKEIPIVVQEYLNWHFVSSLTWFSLFLTIFLICAWIFKGTLNKPWEDEHGPMTDSGIFGIISLIAGVVSFIFLVASHTWLKILIAPRVFLLEEFKYLLN